MASPTHSAGGPPSRRHEPLELDEDWDASGRTKVDDSDLVPDDELEIEELDDDSQARGQVVAALRQVRDYLIELDLESKPSGECLDVCRNVLSSLNGTTESVGDEIAAACKALTRSLAKNGKSTSEQLSVVKAKYNSVATLLPELGEFEAERRQRVKLIVRAILEDVPGLGPLGREKLEQAGLGDVEALCRAGQPDLESAGLAPELAARVFERVARFKRRLNSVPPDADRSSERERLKRLTSTLRQQNEQFESLADDWKKGSAQARRELRDQRSETMSQVSLLLARLGELGIAERIERLPFDKKATELERLLGALDDTHGQSP